MPSCDRRRRCAISDRRDTGAGSSRCVSAGEKSSALLVNGTIHAAAAAAIMPSPATGANIAITAGGGAADCLSWRRRADPDPLLPNRRKKLK